MAERPAHPLDLPSFHIARYPVTDAQYRCFVESGGYETREYWDGGLGLAARCGP